MILNDKLARAQRLIHPLSKNFVSRVLLPQVLYKYQLKFLSSNMCLLLAF